jgi:hypothetical protein
MEEEKIVIKAKLKKGLKSLARLMGELGFSKISFNKSQLTVEKIKGHDLRGKPFLEYRMEFKENSIVLSYNVPPKKNKRAVLLELLPTFLGILQVAEEYYDMAPSAVYSHVNSVLKEMLKIVDKDSTELSTALSDLEAKHAELTAKYDVLVSSSEANAKILMECERKRDELAKRVEMLTKLSDEALKESLYEWIRMHGGSINVKEFAKSNAVSIPRVEEGLNNLISEGFIKRRID